MEDGFENAVADKSHHHPMEPDECHRTIGVVHHDVGVDAVKHLAEIDEGKEPEEDGGEVGQHMHRKVLLAACVVVEEDDTDDECDDKPSEIFLELAGLKSMVLSAEESHVIEYQGFRNADDNKM